MNILRAMKRSSLGLDVYLWLTCRLFTASAPLRLSWPQLYRQLGAHPEATSTVAVQNLRQDIIRELEKLRVAWPQLRFSIAPGALILMPAKPRIAPTTTPPLKA